MNRADVDQIQSVGVKVYPNPTNSFVNVITTSDFGSHVQIQLTTISGQIIKTVNAQSGLNQINVSNFSDGVYLVKVTNGQKVVTEKISVQK